MIVDGVFHAVVLESPHIAFGCLLDLLLRVYDSINHTRHPWQDKGAETFCYKVETVDLIVFIIYSLSLNQNPGFEVC